MVNRRMPARHSLFASSSAPCTRAFAYARVATPCGVAMHGVYLVSQGAQAGGSQLMGLGMFFPPHVLWERIAIHDTRFLTCRLLAVAPRGPGNKRKLLYCYDGSDEHSHVFPVPYTSASPDRLVRSVLRLHRRLMRGCAGRLTVASHAPITRDARTVEVASFQKRFRCRNKAP